ncbi:MAG TPA: ribonuclease H [Haliangium sp.]|nr:ribonuclease H [Haliangium sp.]
MAWIRRKLRNEIVYVRVDGDGKPAPGPDGRVDVRYKPSAAAKVYRAALRNLEPTDDPGDEIPVELPGIDSADSGEVAAAAPASGSNGASARSSTGTGAGASAGASAGAAGSGPAASPIVVYTDGACTGNPGPAGIGVVILDGKQRRELSEYLGQGTNNIAELAAIERALEAVAAQDRARPVLVHSDSSYAIGLLSKGWKARANADLVARIRQLARSFSNLRFVKVRGHSGVAENERCDVLARSAIDRRS